MSDPTYTITAMTERNFGDHGAVMPTSFEPVEGETVQELILRVLPNLTKPYYSGNPQDQIILRVTSESVERLAEASKPSRDPSSKDPF